MFDMQFIQGVSTPRWQAEAKAEPRSGAETTPGQVLVSKSPNANEGNGALSSTMAWFLY